MENSIDLESIRESLSLTMERERIISIRVVICDDPHPRPLKVLKNVPYRERRDMNDGR